MRVESVDTPSLLELRATVAQRLHAYGAFEGCTAEDRRTILAQACLAIWHLTAGEEGRLLYLSAPRAPGRRGALSDGTRHDDAPVSGCHRRRAGIRRRVAHALPAGRMASDPMGWVL